MKDIIQITVENREGERREIEIPTDVSLNLMEVLKASEYPVLATCGGMALCATCLIQVLEGEAFKEATDPEWDMLDTLPEVLEGHRLACQMPVNASMDGLVIRLGELN